MHYHNECLDWYKIPTKATEVAAAHRNLGYLTWRTQTHVNSFTHTKRFALVWQCWPSFQCGMERVNRANKILLYRMAWHGMMILLMTKPTSTSPSLTDWLQQEYCAELKCGMIWYQLAFNFRFFSCSLISWGSFSTIFDWFAFGTWLCTRPELTNQVNRMGSLCTLSAGGLTNQEFKIDMY